MDEQPKPQAAAPAPVRHRNAVPFIIALIIIILGLGGALVWALFYKPDTTTSSKSSTAASSSSPAPATTGPCTGGTTNPAPTGYTFYESTEYGFKFAYPTAWGTPVVTNTPTGGVGGHYLNGHFTTNSNVTFGGNATDYIVQGRDGIPTDNPGYLQAAGKFYTVQIWTFRPVSGPDEPKHDLFPIAEATALQSGCNAKAAVTKYLKNELSDAHDVARFNLQPTNSYYGVNFVLNNPDAAKRTDFEKLLSTFQLIP